MKQASISRPVEIFPLRELEGLVKHHDTHKLMNCGDSNLVRLLNDLSLISEFGNIKLDNMLQLKIFSCIMRQVCLERTPCSRAPYYNLISCSSVHIDYVSMGIAWDELSEVRGPRPVNGMMTKNKRMLAGRKIYVLESDLEFWLWFKFWKKEALVAKDVGNIYLQ